MNAQEKRQSFDKIAFEHMDTLYNTALRLTRNPVGAEDLVQDTYLRAFRFFHKFQKGTNFKAWIFRILMNTFINQYRKKSREPQKVDFDKVEFATEDSSAENVTQAWEGYDESSYTELYDDDIVTALEKLSDEFRMVVILADAEGFSYKEIADIIGHPIGTVMSRLSRGRKMLQSQLKQYAIKRGFIK
jgi:RNA polymerase sigma-70 factor (ECF subfamily)